MLDQGIHVGSRSSHPRMIIDENGYQDLLSAIYDLALAPANWAPVLRLLAAAFNCPYAASVTTTPERDRPRSLGAVGISADDHRTFLCTWHERNVFAVRRPARQPGAIVVGRTMLPKSRLVRTPMYRHYLAPRGIEEVARLDIFCDPCRSQSISLGRPWRAGPYTPGELAFAGTLMPHLQRVAAVHAHVEASNSIARTALDALHGALTPSLLLNATGRVIYASSEAERLLRRQDGLCAGKDGLYAATPSLTARLRAVLARAAGSGRTPGMSGSLHLRRPSGKPDLVAVALPIRSGSPGPVVGDACVIVQLIDPLARALPNRDMLIGAFDLTPAEAALAADLLCGLSVAEAASSRGRSVATVRTHLASLLAKTATARQSDLVRLLSRLPCTGRPLAPAT